MNPSNPKSGFVQLNGIRLHYLDWGGEGPALIFLTGMGSSAYIYNQFAPRFSDRFRVLGLTRRGHGDSDYPETGYDANTLTEDIRGFMDCLEIEKAVLVGHSIAGVELTHFAARYPKRIEKLAYLDALDDRRRLLLVGERSPLIDIQIKKEPRRPRTLEEYITFFRQDYPEFDAIWSELWDEEFAHGVTVDSDGTYIDRMPPAIEEQLNENLVIEYVPKKVKATIPILAFYSLGLHHVSNAYTSEQKAQYEEYYRRVMLPAKRLAISDFQSRFPHASIIEIPDGHHYCFIAQEELVYEEMRKLLLD